MSWCVINVQAAGGHEAAAFEATPLIRLEVPMGLREKYHAAIGAAKGFKMDGAAEERDGKLHIRGTVTSEDQKNKIWDAIKTVPDYAREVVADIRVVAPATMAAGAGAPAAAASRTYTVQPGDTLSKIAKEHLGSATAYMKIFEANRDQLSNPDLIKPGQVLKIPAS
jgi:LysM repeat protein